MRVKERVWEEIGKGRGEGREGSGNLIERLDWK